MTDQDGGWYEQHSHRVDFLGHTEPRRNDALHVYLKAGGRLSEWPRTGLSADAAMIDRALGLTPQMEKAAE